MTETPALLSFTVVSLTVMNLLVYTKFSVPLRSLKKWQSPQYAPHARKMWQPLWWGIGCVSPQRATTLLRGCVSSEKTWVHAENMACQWSHAYIPWVSCILKYLLNSWIRYLTSPLVYLLLWAGRWPVPLTPLKQKANQFCSSFWVHKIRKIWQ